MELRSRRSNAGVAIVDAIPADTPGTSSGVLRCGRRSTGCATNWPPSSSRRLKEFVRDPWATRDDYIRVILDRSEETRRAFFADHAIRPLEPHEQVTVLKLLEMQRHAMLMYTSCGWFFDELSGIETVQVIHYAGRALQLAEECCDGKTRAGISAAPRTGKKQSARTRRRRKDLRKVGEARCGGYRTRRRPLCHQFFVRELSGKNAYLLLRGGTPHVIRWRPKERFVWPMAARDFGRPSPKKPRLSISRSSILETTT